MRRAYLYILLVLILGAAGYYGVTEYKGAPHPRKTTTVSGEDPELRLKKLHAQQDAEYSGRYGQIEARIDIDRGTPKLQWYGLYRECDTEWEAIIQKRFGVKAGFIAACETSASLANYADAYNAIIEKYIADKFGADALAKSREDAMRVVDQKAKAEPNHAPPPTPPKGG